MDIETFITDRTADDVSAAKKIRKEKLQNGIELSEEDTAVLERGMVSRETIGRIENAQADLKEELERMAYFLKTPIINKSWTKTDVFYEEDLARLAENDVILRDAFYDYRSTPANPRAEYHYRELNSMEKILQDLFKMVAYTKANYKECGAYECGG
jgi:transcriptional regulator with XRE-family HTH domain